MEQRVGAHMHNKLSFEPPTRHIMAVKFDSSRLKVARKIVISAHKNAKTRRKQSKNVRIELKVGEPASNTPLEVRF
jgi:hypothetical protein